MTQRNIEHQRTGQSTVRLERGTPIVFMGSMNAMPMMYAVELRNRGHNVLYFVDAPKSNTLSRPEHHYPSITYPYPQWIVERVLPSQILLPLLPRIFAALYQTLIQRVTRKSPQCYVANGLFISLLPYLPKQSRRIALSHGSDLDVWAHTEGVALLAASFGTRSIFRYLPGFLCDYLLKRIVRAQFLGLSVADSVAYFPTGFNANGDRVLSRLKALGVQHVPRFDISFEPVRGQPRGVRSASGRLEILSAVRFLYRTFPNGNRGYNKGNDIILRGIAKYFAESPHIRIHLIEKGEDVQHAKALCRELGLEGVTVWHKEMPFRTLLSLYEKCDICFDQLGDNWMGAIGAYSLWLGKPLIANVSREVASGIWPAQHPVCCAQTEEDILNWLRRLANPEVRQRISIASMTFAEHYLGPDKALRDLFGVSHEA